VAQDTRVDERMYRPLCGGCDDYQFALVLTSREYGELFSVILEAEQEGAVTRTFRRLDPTQHVAIIDAVLKEMIEVGRQGATMRGIAHRLGMAAASLYGYFPDREAMIDFTTSAAARISLLVAADESDVGDSATLEQGLRDHLVTDLDYVATHWSIIKYYAQAGYRGELPTSQGVLEPIASGMQSRVQRLLDQAEERGELRADLDPDAVSRVVNTLMLVLADARFVDHLNDYLRLYPDDDSRAKETIDVAIDIIARGIGA